MADPFSINPTDEVGSGEGSGTNAGAVGAGGSGVMCSVCGKMKKTEPTELEETDVHQYCECETPSPSGREPSSSSDAPAKSVTFFPFVRVYPTPREKAVGGRTKLILLGNKLPGPRLHLEKFVEANLVREDYHPPPGEDPEKCGICSGKIKEGNVIGRMRCCTHNFHFDCIKQWLMENNECPHCNLTAIADC